MKKNCAFLKEKCAFYTFKDLAIFSIHTFFSPLVLLLSYDPCTARSINYSCLTFWPFVFYLLELLSQDKF